MVLVRLARTADAAAIAELYRPYVEHSRISFEEQAPGAAEMERRIAGKKPGYHPWLVAEERGGLLGFASSSPFRARRAYRWSVETGIYLAADARGRGVGRQLLGALTDLLERQNYVSAIGAIALPNDASIALHEAVGFRRAGVYREVGFKHGRWIDVGFWQCELNESAVPPVTPKRFADVGVVRG